MKVKDVLKYYLLCNKLKDTIRTGWINWKVKKERLESVAEHIYGVQMLAIAIYSEYRLELDLKKVILMLAVHELEEIKIGDIAYFDMDRTKSKKLGHRAIKILNNLIGAEEIVKLILEFDERKTKEAKFAFCCDKLECDIQCKLYDEENYIDIYNQDGNPSLNNKEIYTLLQEEKSISGMWSSYSQKNFDYDEIFMELSNYIKNNRIKDLID